MASVSVFPSPQELGAFLARSVAAAAAQAVTSGGRFSLGLSGGSLVPLLARELGGALADVGGAQPARWILAFCDERLVPPEHPESTCGAYRSQVLSQFPPPGPRVLSVNPGLDPNGAARDYWEQIRTAFPDEPIPQFDLLLLGVGPDGHTCSLFPGHALLQEQDLLIGAIVDSPKPPPERVTMTLPLLNATKSVLVVATGASKSSVIKKILQENDNSLPAARIRPRSGKLRWLLDEEAAKELEIPVEKYPKN